MRLARAAAAIAALIVFVSPPTVRAQGISLPVGLHIGVPQGEFAENVKIAGGVGVSGLFPIASEFGFRAGLDFLIYGADTRRVPLGGGALGLITVDVNTTNAIVGGNLGFQMGMPGPRPRPYLGGLIGFSAFTTSSSVSGSNSSDEPFASSTNSNDVAFSKIALAGLYIPFAKGRTIVDLGVRYTWNGKEVRYLTPGDITEDVGGDIVINARRSRADLLTVVLGVAIRAGGPRR